MEPSDLDLLRAYSSDGDESAFSELVDRHGPWVFAAARRRLGDDHLADDATQATFVLLAEKAARLAGSKRQSLAGWLFHAVHFACVRARRARARRARHESEASLRHTHDTERPGTELLALLEDAIAQLPPQDRDAIAQRFYQREDLAAVGRALNTTPEAARKRVNRALLALRRLMLRDGFDVVPTELLSRLGEGAAAAHDLQRAKDVQRINMIAKGTTVMMQQARASEFKVVSAEFFVNDVEANLAFFEKLGFTARWTETPDAMGRVPRASLASGAARVWLRRATDTEGTRPAPGVGVFFRVDGPDALAAHRDRIVAQGIEASPFFDDHTLRNFTVRTPDAYSIGFFTAYRTTAEATRAGT